MSRYGSGDASDSVSYLQEQDIYLGSWAGWQHLGCDNDLAQMTDWAVIKVSNSEWYMNHAAPASGQC